MAKSLFTKRLSKELRDLNTNPIEGVLIEEADDFKKWRLQLTGAPGTIYENEEFKLEFRFTPSYPLESPEVLFIRPYIPIHPHVSNRTKLNSWRLPEGVSNALTNDIFYRYIPMVIYASTSYIRIGHLSKR
ncbi:unnamed protein product [Absidia cylindrospora]